MTVSDLLTDPMFKLAQLCARWFNAIIMGVVAAMVFHDAVRMSFKYTWSKCCSARRLCPPDTVAYQRETWEDVIWMVLKMGHFQSYGVCGRE